MPIKSNCQKLIKDEFENVIKDGMITAELLHKRIFFNNYQVNTIKTTLSRLKKKKYLRIAFRTRGKFTENISLEGKVEFKKGKCYYKLY